MKYYVTYRKDMMDCASGTYRGNQITQKMLVVKLSGEGHLENRSINAGQY